MTILVDESGNITPLSFKWEDGTIFFIDKVRERRNAASTKVGGCGVRYKVVIQKHEKYIFEEDGKWFVEGIKQF